MTFRRRAVLVLALALLAGIVVAVHRPTLSARAIAIDDDQYLTENALVQNPGWASASRFLTEVLEPSTVAGYYQPLTMISLMLDTAQGGRPDYLRPYHRTSLALHTANTLLVSVLLYLLFGQSVPAIGLALLFGVHPLFVEPIPWVTERKTLLATFFALLCLIAYVQYTRGPRWGWYAAALVASLLALLSKPTTTPLPLLLVLLDCWPLRRLRARTLWEKVPFLALAVLSAIITFVSQRRTAVATLPTEHSAWSFPLIACHNIVFYLHKLVWPADLTPHYPIPDPLTLAQPGLLVGLVGTCVLVAALVLSLRWTRAALVGWLFFFVAIFPTLGLVGFTHVIAADKYAYFPIIGLLLPAAAGLAVLWTNATTGGQRRRLVVPVAICALAIAAGSATRHQLSYWQTTDELYAHMLRLAPDSAILHNNYGAELDLVGRLEEARAHLARAVALAPQYADAQANYGTCLLRAGRHAEAAAALGRAVELNPQNGGAYQNLGNARLELGQTDDAIAALQRAVTIYTSRRQANSRVAAAHNSLAVALRRRGDTAAAVEEYRRAIEAAPEYYEARTNLGYLLLQAGQAAAAADELKRAIDTDPSRYEGYYLLGLVAEAQGRWPAAIEAYQTAVRIAPQSADARARLEAAQHRQP